MEDARADPIVFPGIVERSGEDLGISLEETPDGPFVARASFFRIVLSPHGRGHVQVLLQSPQEASPPAERGNVCLHATNPWRVTWSRSSSRISARSEASLALAA
jgi:hypothetical protein